jgi:hypothetical protein
VPLCTHCSRTMSLPACWTLCPLSHTGAGHVAARSLGETPASGPGRTLQQAGGLDLSKLDLSSLPSLPALGLMPGGIDLPPLAEFLPPLDAINLPPLNEFLTSVGLPTWEEMNLPPLSEFMKPVFDPQAVRSIDTLVVYVATMGNSIDVVTLIILTGTQRRVGSGAKYMQLIAQHGVFARAVC